MVRATDATGFNALPLRSGRFPRANIDYTLQKAAELWLEIDVAAPGIGK